MMEKIDKVLDIFAAFFTFALFFCLSFIFCKIELYLLDRVNIFFIFLFTIPTYIFLSGILYSFGNLLYELLAAPK